VSAHGCQRIHAKEGVCHNTQSIRGRGRWYELKSLVRWLCSRPAPSAGFHRYVCVKSSSLKSAAGRAGLVCRSPLRRYQARATRNCPQFTPVVSLAAPPKRRSRVGVEGGRRSSERLGYSQQCLRDVKGAGHRRHVVQHWGAATLEQRGSGVLEHTYPLADPQGVCRLHAERHKDKRRRAVTVDSGRQGQRGPDR
jgi:hypothetical protein